MSKNYSLEESLFAVQQLEVLSGKIGSSEDGERLREQLAELTSSANLLSKETNTLMIRLVELSNDQVLLLLWKANLAESSKTLSPSCWTASMYLEKTPRAHVFRALAGLERAKHTTDSKFWDLFSGFWLAVYEVGDGDVPHADARRYH